MFVNHDLSEKIGNVDNIIIIEDDTENVQTKKALI